MLTHSWHNFAPVCAIVDTIMDMENPNADTLLTLFFPICIIIDTVMDMENPNADTFFTLFLPQRGPLFTQYQIWRIPVLTHIVNFCTIFWHLLGLYDLMLEGRETVANIHTYCIYHLP